MDINSLGVSFEKDDLVTDLKNRQERSIMFDLSSSEKSLELFEITNNNVLVRFKVESPD